MTAADYFRSQCAADERESVCSPRWLAKQTDDELRAMIDRAELLWPGPDVEDWRKLLRGALEARTAA
jgi:hypothetical protein